MRLNEQAEQALDEFAEEMTEARREENLIYHEGCAIVTVPTIPPPEYITVTVDGVNDPNVMWRGVPATPAVGDEVLVWENPVSHRREIASASGAAGVTAKYSWCQTVVVAKCNGDFDDITDAIAYINALAAGPAANRYFALFVLAGNWVETANVVIPDYVWVFGLGEATSIEMGAFDIVMGNHTGLCNVRATFAANGWIDINGKTDVILDHVHGIQSSNTDVLYVYGASSHVECKDCHFESTGNEAVYVKDTSSVRFDNCKLEASAGAGYAIVIGDTATVRMEWCELTAYVPVFTVAGTTFSHFSCQFNLAASALAAGSHTALSTKRFNQTLIVAKAGGEFTTLSAAIAYINAQGDAAAAKLYGVLMLAGNFAEAAGVTIPSYVHVVGMSEGTELEMGANILTMSSNSGLFNIKVEATNPARIINCNGVTGVMLRHVHARTSVAGIPLYIVGASDVEVHDCIFVSGNATVGAVWVTGGTVLFNHVLMEGGINAGGYGIFMAGTPVVTAKWCEMTGFNPINLAAGTLNHYGCQFDPDTSVLAGTEVPMVTGKANYDDVVTFENGVTFDGASAANVVTVPDNVAQAMHIVDAGDANDYLTIISTDGTRAVVINEDGHANIDFRVESDNFANMLTVDAGMDTVMVNSAADLGCTFGVVTTAAADIGVVIRAAATQTADLVQFQNSAGTINAVVYGSGVSSGLYWRMGQVGRGEFYIVPDTAGNIYVYLYRMSTALGSMFQYMIGAATYAQLGFAGGSSDFVWRSTRTDVSVVFTLAGVETFTISPKPADAWTARLISRETAKVGLVVQAYPVAPTADLQQWRDGAAGVLACVTVDGELGVGATVPATLVELEKVDTLTGNLADGYAAALTLDPGYTAAFTVARHNYIDCQDVSVAGGAAVTDAAVFRFDAAIGTHKCLPVAFDTTDSNGDTTSWAGGLYININGTLYKIPYIAA